MRRKTLPLAALLLTVAAVALALPIDRGLVEDGTDGNVSDGGTDAGVMLVNGQGTTRLRPATCAGGSCTRVAPDAGTEGLSLEDITSFAVTLCAAPGQVLSAGGELEFWRYDPVIARWGHMDGKDLSITVTDACQGWPVEVNGMQGAGVRALYRPTGVVPVVYDGGRPITSMQACKRGSVPLGSFGTPGCGT